MSARKKISEIYVRGYSRHVQKEQLKDLFRKYGKIKSIRFKGHYSFIVTIPHQEFKDYYDAEKAVDNMHNKRIEGYKLIVQPAQTKRKIYTRQRSRSDSQEKKRLKKNLLLKAHRVHNKIVVNSKIRERKKVRITKDKQLALCQVIKTVQKRINSNNDDKNNQLQMAQPYICPPYFFC